MFPTCFFTHLNGDNRSQKDIVEGLGFDTDIDLLDTETETPYQLFHWTHDETETGLGQTTKLSPAFNDSDFGSTDSETAGNTHLVDIVVVLD